MSLRTFEVVTESGSTYHANHASLRELHATHSLATDAQGRIKFEGNRVWRVTPPRFSVRGFSEKYGAYLEHLRREKDAIGMLMISEIRKRPIEAMT